MSPTPAPVPSSPAAFRRLRTFAVGIAVSLAGTLLAPRTALAGDPVKLQIELPPDVTSLRAGEAVDVQVVPIDAAGARVVPGGRTIEVSATAGTFEVVKRPYEYRFTAPAKPADFTDVRLRAWFKEAPEVAGEATVRVTPPPPFKRIVIDGAGTAPAGSRLDLRVRGEAPDGAMTDLTDALAEAKVEGPGAVSYLRAGWLRYQAPDDAKGTATVVVTLRRHPEVAASHPVLVAGTGDAAPPPPAPPAPGVEPTPPKETPKEDGGKGGAEAPPPPPTEKGEKGEKGEKSDEPEGVVWPGGNLKVGTWRTRSESDTEFAAEAKDLPKPGGEFTATKEWQKLRIVVLRTDVSKVEVEEYVGERRSADVKRLEPSKDGRFRLEKNKKGNFVVHYEGQTPEGGKPLVCAILLSTADGKVVREELTLRRAAATKRK